jgi:hypothetical protein
MSSSIGQGARRDRVVWLGVFLVALVVAVGLTWVRVPISSPVYRDAAERFWNGEQFYRPQERQPFTYPPFCVLTYLPLLLLPQPLDRVAWYLITFAVLGGVLAVLRRLTYPIVRAGEARGGPSSGWATALIALLSARYVISPIEYESHDLLLLLLILLGVAAWARDAAPAAGLWTGLAAACKATPLLWAAVFLWQRRWRAVAGFGAVLVAATFLPDLLVRNPEEPLWVQSWHAKFLQHVEVGEAAQAEGAWASWNALNQSLSGTLYRLFTVVESPSPKRWNIALYPLDRSTLRAVNLVAALAVLGVLLYACWPKRPCGLSDEERAFCRVGQGGAVLCAMLLLSPMSSTYHFCLLLPSISFLVVDFLYRGRDPWVGGYLVFLALFGSVAAKDIIGDALHNTLTAYGASTWVTLGCLLVSTYVVVCRLGGACRSDAGCTHPDSTPMRRQAA